MPEAILEEPARTKELTPLALARGWLNFRAAEVRKELRSAEGSRQFVSTYKSEPVIRPSNVEVGSMDDSDWTVAELEHEQWPEEQEAQLEQLDERLDELYDQQSTIADHRKRINKGDTDLINQFAQLEKDRLKKLEDARKLEEALKQGFVFEGVEEVVTNLDHITNVVGNDQVGADSALANGWRLVQHYPREVLRYSSTGEPYGENPEQFQLYYTPDPEAGDRNVFMRMYVRDTEYELVIEDFRDRQNADSIYGKATKATKGTCLSLSIENGRIFRPWTGTVIEDARWGYPETHHVEGSYNFTQEHFDQVKTLIASLAAGIDT
ncbi:hypothetical protein M1555_00630 [Patescibacteria group bacterium]|nr:hypothetical protein [Patescibacteria group bacterium]